MEQNKSWLKFIITGRAEDYLLYVENAKKEKLSGGDNDADNNRRSGYKRDEYKG